MIDRVRRSFEGVGTRAAERGRRSWKSPSFTPLRFEELETRALLTVTPLDGAPYVYVGPSDNFALDQPRVAVEFVTGEEVSVDSASLVFTPEDGPNRWDIPQTVTVSAIDDHWQEGSHTATIKYTAASQDANFNGIVNQYLEVDIADNDPTGDANPCSVPPPDSGPVTDVLISHTEGSTQVVEGGATDTYTVVLTSQPTDPVEISVYFFDVNEQQRCSVGPTESFNTSLLDTGANSILSFASQVAAMDDPPYAYATEGVFEEEGVAGTDVYDISDPYRFDFAGSDGERHMVRDTRVLSDADQDISIFGPWGIVGMPAMAGRVTSLDMTVWTNPELSYMGVDFSDSVPADNGNRFSVAVDNRLTWDPEPQVSSGDYPPVWADIPFLTGSVMQDSSAVEGTFLLDTGAQLSVMPVSMALDLGLDSNGDGLLDENDDNFARNETVGGIGGSISAPVFLFDEFHVPTTQGPDLVWTDLQWLVLDIAGGQFGVFGCENLTSGWIETYFGLSAEPGYFEEVHFDFRDFEVGGNPAGTASGVIHFDVNPNVGQITDASVPGATIVETDRYTMATEDGMQDLYQIALTQQPEADVTITLSNPGGELTAVDSANPTNGFLVFTPANWDVPQTVRVTAINDGAPEGFHRDAVFHTTSSADPDYQDVDIRRVLVNIVDSNSAGVMLLPNDDTTDVVEGGVTDSYQIVLTGPPSSSVTVELRNSYDQVTAVDSANPGNDFLVFTSENWATPQTVLVTAVDDAVAEGAHHTRIMHRLSTGDYSYQQTYVFPKPVNITDNDTAPTLYDDIVGRAASSGDWFVAKSDGTSFANEHWGKWTTAVTWSNVLVGDFTGDGKDDVVGRADSTGDWFVAKATDSGFVTEHWGKWTTAVTWDNIMVGDFNGDGKDDLVGRAASSGDWFVGRSTGTGFAMEHWGKWTTAVNWNHIQVGDFNGDGYDDLVGRAPSSGDWFVAKSSSTNFATEHWGKWTTAVTWSSVLVGDFNGDGKDDVVGRADSSGDWFTSRSTGSSFAFEHWGKWTTAVTWDNIMVGDFNGDGYDDLIGRAPSSGDWFVARSSSTSFAMEHWGKWTTAVNWSPILTGDFTGDGKDDLAARADSSGDWFVSRSTGTSLVFEHWGRWTTSVPWVDIQVGDFDGAGGTSGGSDSSASPAAADFFWSEVGDTDDEDDSLLVENQIVDLLKMSE